jgi:hypothetical protein
LNRTGSVQTGSQTGPRRAGTAARSDTGEIRNAERAEHVKSATIGEIDSAQALRPAGADYSDGLYRAPEARQSAMEPITQHLGNALTIANPVWTGNPVPDMRALQKKLIEYSLAVSPEERGPCLQAITVVEGAVRMRLRLQQMRMDDLSMQFGTEAQER